MGKGKRNRERTLQDRLASPAAKNLKNKKKSGMPSWLTSAIAILVVVVILLPLIISAIQESGFFERRRILIESQSGEFDVNQQMATFIAWEALYESGLQYYQFVQYGIYQDTTGITSLSANEYAKRIASSSIESNLRDCIDNVVDVLKQYVAVCDLAHKEGMKLTEEDMAQVDEVVTWLDDMRTSEGFSSLDKFLNYYVGTGIKEKDVRAATELVVLHNKYVSEKQLDLDSKITLENLIDYRIENPMSFYKIDYLTYAVKDKDLSEKLKACKTPEEFSNLVIDIIFDENYQTLYNQYTLLDEVTTIFEDQFDGIADDNNGTALSDAWVALGVNASKDYSKEDETLDEDLKDWLFDAKREQFDSDVVTAEDGIYLVSFYSEKAGGTTVQARAKFYEFRKGEEIKEELRDVLKKEFKDEDVTYDYKTAVEKAEAIKEALSKKDAEIDKLLKEYAAISVTGVVSDTTDVPSAIRKDVLSDAIKTGDIRIVKDGDVRYVVYVRNINTKQEAETIDESTEDSENTEEEETPITADIDYVKCTTDLFCLLRDDLQKILDDDYSSSNSATFEEEPKDDYKKFLFALTEDDGIVSARKHGDTTVIEKTDEAKKETTYTAYMAIQNTKYDEKGEMLYYNKDPLVNGGYLLFEKEDAAKAALEKLTGKTGEELSEAFAELTSDVSSNKIAVSETNSRADIDKISEDMGEWMFDAARKDGDLKIIEKKGSGDKIEGYYLVYYVDAIETWETSARSLLLSEQVQDWLDEISEPYTVNEKVLKKIGEPSPSTEEETAA